MEKAERTQIVRTLASEQGFDRVGIAPAERLARADYLRRWLAEGQAGEMGYLRRYFDRRVDPAKLLPGAKSVVVTALNYHTFVVSVPFEEICRVEIYAVHPEKKPENKPMITGFKHSPGDEGRG